MKRINDFVRVAWVLVVLVSLGAARLKAGEAVAQALQKGLIEEEANQNLPGAIQAYQAVLKQFDEERKTAALATFRLGECFRKQGQTNQALAQFERVVREFSDQGPLVTLSAKYAAELGRATPGGQIAAGADASTQVSFDPEQVKLLNEEIALVKQQIESTRRAYENGNMSSADLIQRQRELIELERKLPENAAPAQQRALIEQEMKFAEQLLQECRKRVENGVVAPAEEIPFKRDLLNLQRELLAVQDASRPGVRMRLQSIVKRAPAEEEINEEETKEIQRIREMIKNSPDLVNAPATEHGTPLQNAAHNGQLAVARFLLDNGADINGSTKSLDDRTALHMAAESGHKAMVELLLERGAEVDVRDRAGATPLARAAWHGYPAVAQVLLSKGADVNSRDSIGQTPLHNAVATSQKAVIELLLAHKADINAQDSVGRTPLFDAVKTKRADVVKLLLTHHADPNLKDKSGSNPLTESVSQHLQTITDLLLNAGANPNVVGIRNGDQGNPPRPAYTAPLQFAATEGDLALIEKLLKHGADINLQDDLGRTAVSCSIKQPPALKALLEAGAKPNLETFGSTPLLAAVVAGEKPAVELLLAHGADANVKTESGSAPLLEATRVGSKELVALLLAAGAVPDVQTAELYTPLHIAASLGAAEIAEQLIAKGADVNATDANGNTPLHYAAFRSQRALVDLLLAHGAKLDVTNQEGETPLKMISDASYHQISPWGIPVRNPGYNGGSRIVGESQRALVQFLQDLTSKEKNKGTNQ